MRLKKLNIVNFIKRDDKIYDYKHKSGIISGADLNKEQTFLVTKCLIEVFVHIWLKYRYKKIINCRV